MSDSESTVRAERAEAVRPVRPRMTDERLEGIMAHVLRAGVFLGAAVVLLGGLLYIWRHGQTTPAYSVFRGEPADLRDLWSIVLDAAHGSARGIIQVGLMLIIATPISRVTFALVGFSVEHDYLYVLVCSIVLGALLWGVAGGF